jgi:hypothetical protein
MQVGSRESIEEDARADVSCKLRKLDAFNFHETSASPALDSRDRTCIVWTPPRQLAAAPWTSRVLSRIIPLRNLVILWTF